MSAQYLMTKLTADLSRVPGKQMTKKIQLQAVITNPANGPDYELSRAFTCLRVAHSALVAGNLTALRQAYQYGAYIYKAYACSKMTQVLI